ncbi:MAG: helix-turn-helix domain-containing protein [Betaproteobacteria bacterium]|nr:helix-turn-helix domain-containing protein [Betaproteobacteria bacterium]
MDKQHFDQLVKSVREMKRHMAGKGVRGVRITELPPPDVRTVREAAKISQSQFAKLIGVNLRTLQNWEQQRTQPTGPATHNYHGTFCLLRYHLRMRIALFVSR